MYVVKKFEKPSCSKKKKDENDFMYVT